MSWVLASFSRSSTNAEIAVRRMLESMSYKQGAKFDSPNSVREIRQSSFRNGG